MSSIGVDELKIGQIFSHPVYIEDDIVLVPAGIAIRKKDLERLRTWKIQNVETEGGLQSVTETFMPPENLWGLPVDEKDLNYYTKNVHRIDEIFTRICNMERVLKHEIEEIVSSIIDTVETNQKSAIRLVLAGIKTRKIYAKDALNSSILSLIIGLRLDNTKDELFQLCCAALLHDVGMQRFFFGITRLNRKLKAEEQQSLKAHPIHSYKIVRYELQFSDEIAQSVLQHHERWDGEGYPRGFKGAEILFNSRIIAVVDAFVAMISERLWRSSMIGYEAVKVVLENNQRRFDPEIVKLIVGILGIYPVGTLVQLSDGSIGRVCDTNDNIPLRPEILTLIDKTGLKLQDDMDPTIIDLHNNKNLFITRVVNSNCLLTKSMSESEK